VRCSSGPAGWPTVSGAVPNDRPLRVHGRRVPPRPVADRQGALLDRVFSEVRLDLFTTIQEAGIRNYDYALLTATSTAAEGFKLPDGS